MNKSYRLPQFIIFVIFTFVSPLNASDSNTDTCDKNLAQCILELTQKIEQTPVASHMWFHQKLNLLDLLFQAQEYAAVVDEVDKLLALPYLPPRLEINSLMYKVKMGKLNGEEDLEQYIKRVDEAFSNLANSAPQSIIDYATFQLYTGDYAKGRKLLLDLEKKFQKHSNYHIKKQIYTILGHLSHRLKDLDATMAYILLAYENAHKDEGIHYRLMTSYNVARALHFLERFEEAEPKFKEVIEQASVINEISYQSLSYLRLAEMASARNDLVGLKTILNQIETKHLMPYDLELFNKLQQRL